VPERPSLSALSAARGPFGRTGRDRQRLSGMPQEEMEGIFVCHHFPSLECRWLRTGTKIQRSVGFLRRFRRHERDS